MVSAAHNNDSQMLQSFNIEVIRVNNHYYNFKVNRLKQYFGMYAQGTNK